MVRSRNEKTGDKVNIYMSSSSSRQQPIAFLSFGYSENSFRFLSISTQFSLFPFFILLSRKIEKSKRSFLRFVCFIGAEMYVLCEIILDTYVLDDGLAESRAQ